MWCRRGRPVDGHGLITGGHQDPDLGQHRAIATADCKDVRAYFDKVAAHVDRFRQYPLASALRYGEGKVVVIVRVARDGQVLEVEVRQSSGRAPIDDAEVNAFWRDSPPPPDFVGDPVTLVMPINYKIAQ